ncbi:RodZ domain-containing protein [Alkalihalobacillus sp. LMS39]|uniref:helix-turn-helix domain-containing protein n=1 Tax=Alkalihalobacillus sp. LMS39 TaxID=2924032 RepID=UPI001FB51D9F|nr:RodZ domain-containing protein [Alkalihalobacillus sp. LMS39]UOE92780.1 DUF4115 domain-containing protein [Alkalihalobacillus sp. LMS39]
MSELGQRLKESREEKGMSLDDLQKSTKIQRRYLAAIEEGRFDTLPGKFYARAFVKSYSEAVGLNPDEIFEQYQNELPNPSREVKELPSRAERTSTTKRRPVATHRSKFAKIMPTLMAIVFLLVIGSAVWLLLQGNGSDGAAEGEEPPANENTLIEVSPTIDEEPEEEPEPAQDEEPVEEEPVEENESEAEEEQVLVQGETRGNNTFFTLSDTEQFEVDISFSGRSYVGVKNTKGKSFYGQEANDGDELNYDFTGEEEIEFNFGDSRFVTLLINGEEFEFPQDPNKTVHQKVTISFEPTS